MHHDDHPLPLYLSLLPKKLLMCESQYTCQRSVVYTPCDGREPHRLTLGLTGFVDDAVLAPWFRVSVKVVSDDSGGDTLLERG